MATVTLLVGAGRAAEKLVPPRPEVPWIEQPGTPVELAGDGVYFLPGPATVRALLDRADHPCAATRATEPPLTAGDRVVVSADCRVRVGRMPGAARLTLGLRLDPNRDDATDLAALPGVGPRLARRIVEDRARRGPFRDVSALLRVSGLGPATLRALGPHLSFSPD